MKRPRKYVKTFYYTSDISGRHFTIDFKGRELLCFHDAIHHKVVTVVGFIVPNSEITPLKRVKSPVLSLVPAGPTTTKIRLVAGSLWIEVYDFLKSNLNVDNLKVNFWNSRDSNNYLKPSFFRFARMKTQIRFRI